MASLLPVIPRLKNAAAQLANECRQGVRQLLARHDEPTAAEPRTAAALRELETAGFAVLPGFITRERCADLVRRIDAGFEKYAAFTQHDETDSDRRLFGLDAVDDEIRRAAFDEFAVAVLKRYQRAAAFEGFALCARLAAAAGNKGSGGGWHRDSAAYQQTKCMIYLTDVSAENGPFQFIAGSQRPFDVVRSAVKYGYEANQHRYTNEAVERLLAAEPERLRTLTAPAGTAILFDSRGLHRGKPIAAGQRYAITTYLWFNQPISAHVRAWTIESQQRNGALAGNGRY